MTSPTTVVGLRANWGVSNCGQLMGTDKEAGLASIEPEGVYEHLAVGVLEEGYTLVYKTAPGGPDHVKYDVYESSSGIVCVDSHICRNDHSEFVKSTESRTDDGLIAIRQTFTISKNATRVIIRMEITNCHKEKSVNLTDFLVKTQISMSTRAVAPAGRTIRPIGTRPVTRSLATTSMAMLRRASERTSSTWSRYPETWLSMNPS